MKNSTILKTIVLAVTVTSALQPISLHAGWITDSFTGIKSLVSNISARVYEYKKTAIVGSIAVIGCVFASYLALRKQKPAIMTIIFPSEEQDNHTIKVPTNNQIIEKKEEAKVVVESYDKSQDFTPIKDILNQSLVTNQLEMKNKQLLEKQKELLNQFLKNHPHPEAKSSFKPKFTRDMVFFGSSNSAIQYVQNEFTKNKNLVWLVLKENGIIRGFIAYFVKTINSLGHILFLGVDNQSCGKGFAMRLMKEAVEKLRNSGGCTQIELEVRKNNLVAHVVYGKMGFNYATGCCYPSQAFRMVLATPKKNT